MSQVLSISRLYPSSMPVIRSNFYRLSPSDQVDALLNASALVGHVDGITDPLYREHFAATTTQARFNTMCHYLNTFLAMN